MWRSHQGNETPEALLIAIQEPGRRRCAQMKNPTIHQMLHFLLPCLGPGGGNAKATKERSRARKLSRGWRCICSRHSCGTAEAQCLFTAFLIALLASRTISRRRACSLPTPLFFSRPMSSPTAVAFSELPCSALREALLHVGYKLSKELALA